MKLSDFTGTSTLIKFFLRRDRFLLPIWVLLPLLLAVATASSALAYQNLQEFITELTANPMITSILGPFMSLTVAGVVVWRGTGQTVLIVGIASLLSVIRHTRAEEETGRSEMIRAYVTGRFSALTAAMILTCLANLFAGLLLALGLIGMGQPISGAFIHGFTIAFAGIFFAGIGALCAQLRVNTGSAKGMAFMVIGVGILLLILNNGGGGYTGLAWIAPMAWHRLTQPFAGNHGWVFIYFLALSAIPTLLAYYLSTRRDLGAGILAERSGPEKAAPGLKNCFALAWRLHRGAAIGWFAGIVAFGAAIGGIVQSVSDTEGIGDLLGNLGGLNWMAQVGNRDAFMGIMVYILSIAISLYAITAILRLQKEENDNRAEVLLAGPISRIRWMGSHIVITLLTTFGLLLALGLSAGTVYGLTVNNIGGILPHVLGMCLSKVPVVWIMAGLATLLYSFLPRISAALCWGLWALFAIIEFAWEGHIVSWSIMQLTPFAYAHYTIPIASLPVMPLIMLCILTALFVGGRVVENQLPQHWCKIIRVSVCGVDLLPEKVVHLKRGKMIN